MQTKILYGDLEHILKVYCRIFSAYGLEIYLAFTRLAACYAIHSVDVECMTRLLWYLQAIVTSLLTYFFTENFLRLFNSLIDIPSYLQLFLGESFDKRRKSIENNGICPSAKFDLF